MAWKNLEVGRAKRLEHYHKNKATIAPKHKAWYEKNKTRVAVLTAEYRVKNKAKIIAQKIEYVAKNPGKVRKVRQRYYQRHKDRLMATSKAYRSANPDVQRRRHRMARYGLSDERYQAMLAAQDGKCAICKIHLECPHVDHDHRTNIVRELLCSGCNHAIGFAKENPETLESMAAYLRRHT